MTEPTKTVARKVEEKLVDDWKAIFKRWSAQLTILAIAAQTCWGAMPPEAREMLPSPHLIGLGLGIAALISMFVKQKGGTSGETSDDA